MLTQITSSLSLILLFPMAGCFAQSGDPALGQSSDLADRLSEPATLGIVPSDGGSFARVTAVTLRDGREVPVEVEVVEGTLSIALDDAELRVEEMAVTAADLEVGAGVMPPNGATLTGISIALNSPMGALAELGDNTAEIEAGLAVDLRWAVVLDHGVVDLAPIRLPELPFELSVELDADGELEAHLTASQPGPFWSWAGIFQLRDLELDLVASTGQVVPDSVE